MESVVTTEALSEVSVSCDEFVVAVFSSSVVNVTDLRVLLLLPGVVTGKDVSLVPSILSTVCDTDFRVLRRLAVDACFCS